MYVTLYRAIRIALIMAIAVVRRWPLQTAIIIGVLAIGGILGVNLFPRTSTDNPPLVLLVRCDRQTSSYTFEYVIRAARCQTGERQVGQPWMDSPMKVTP